MNPDALLVFGRQALVLMLVASAPPLLASLMVGVLASLFQATTQIQESTLSVAPKLVAAILALALAGPWIGAHLARFTEDLFAVIPTIQ